MDDLAVLEQRDQLAEDRLVAQSDGGNDDDAGALDRLCQVVGRQRGLGDALALIGEEAELIAAQGDAGLLDVDKVLFSNSG